MLSPTDVRFATGGDTARIYTSDDGGASWAWSYLPLPRNTYTQALKFNTPLVGIVGSSSRTLARTSDGGATWTAFTLPGPGTFALAGYDNTYVAANWHAVQVSTDAGQSWTQAYPNDIGQLVGADAVRRAGTVRGWVVGAVVSGGVYTSNVLTYVETVSAIPGEEASRRPASVCLYQNYPFRSTRPRQSGSDCLSARL